MSREIAHKKQVESHLAAHAAQLFGHVTPAPIIPAVAADGSGFVASAA
jgi:hypothetical protein